MNKTIKKNFPNNLLTDILDQICSYDNKNKFYILNNESYKKGQMQNIITTFINNIKPYYNNSKLHYLERNITFKSFLTIIRQICKAQDILYNIKMNYVKSKYELIYSIYYEKPSNISNNSDISNNIV